MAFGLSLLIRIVKSLWFKVDMAGATHNCIFHVLLFHLGFRSTSLSSCVSKMENRVEQKHSMFLLTSILPTSWLLTEQIFRVEAHLFQRFQIIAAVLFGLF